MLSIVNYRRRARWSLCLKIPGPKNCASLGRLVSPALIVSQRRITVVERHKLGGVMLDLRVCAETFGDCEQQDIDSDIIEFLVISLAFGDVMLDVGKKMRRRSAGEVSMQRKLTSRSRRMPRAIEFRYRGDFTCNLGRPFLHILEY